MSKTKPQVIDDEEHERVYDRVAAVDVAKDTGMAPAAARRGRSRRGWARSAR